MRPNGFVSYGLLGALLFGGAACAPLAVGPAAVTEIPKGTEERALVTGAYQGTLEHSGTELAVHVERLCNVERFDLVERTTVRSYENGAPANSVWTGIGGALFACLGGTLAATPSTFADGSTSSNAQVRAAGFGVLAVGAALLAIPAIDYVRTHGEAERHVERVAEPGPMLRHGEACGFAPIGTRVNVELAGNIAPLGTVDERGQLRVDLADVIPIAWQVGPADRAFVKAEDSGIGELSLAELYVRREAAAWNSAAASACIETSECDRERAYARDFAAGPHAKDADERIAASEARVRAAEEEKAWQAIDVAACSKPAPKSTRHDVEVACAPLRAFATAYPASAHSGQFIGPRATGR